MALTATIYKAELHISDIDRHYYASHELRLARHPSETEERLMCRLAAFVYHAHENLRFTKGLSTDDEPELWQKDLTGEIKLWIELGQPTEKRIRKACGQAHQVVIYCYGGGSASVWWDKQAQLLQRHNNLAVFNFPPQQTQALAKVVDRNMVLQCTIQDAILSIMTDQASLSLEPESWKSSTN